MKFHIEDVTAVKSIVKAFGLAIASTPKEKKELGFSVSADGNYTLAEVTLAVEDCIDGTSGQPIAVGRTVNFWMSGTRKSSDVRVYIVKLTKAQKAAKAAKKAKKAKPKTYAELEEFYNAYNKAS